jgi:hypothetical protein
MKAIHFAEANLCLKAPENWDEEKNGKCEDLFVRLQDGMITSIWVPTPEELAVLNAGGGVALTVHSQSQPPVSLWTVPLTIEKAEAPQGETDTPVAVEEEESTEAVEEPHAEVVEPRHGAQALSPEDEHDTIEEVAAKNSRQNG